MNLRFAGKVAACVLATALSAPAQNQNQNQTTPPANQNRSKPAGAKSKSAANSSRSAGKPQASGSETIQPYAAKPIQEYHATEIQPYHAAPVHSQQSTENPVYHSTPVQPSQQGGNSQSGGDRPAPNPHGVSFLGTFGLSIPGVAYSYDNYASNTRTTVTSTGAVTKSAVRINPDHTYDWNSVWDGKIIHGKWTEENGGILLLRGSEGKNWLMRTMDHPSGKATVTLWDQNSLWYNGTPLN